MNQSDTTYAYLAGLVDGEGSLAYYQNGPRMSISNRHQETLLWVREVVGHGRVWQVRDYSQFKRTAPCFQWDCGANGCRELLPKILPFVRISKERVEAMIELLSIIGSKGLKNAPVSALDVERKEQLRNKINGRLYVQETDIFNIKTPS